MPPVAITVRRIKFDRLADSSVALMRAIANSAITIQVDRIQDGIGSNDAAMQTPSKHPNAQGTYEQGYSDERQFGHKETRQTNNITRRYKSGRVRKYQTGGGRTVAVRNLTLTGRMMKARIVKAVTQYTAVIGWVTGIEAQKAGWNDDLTPFIKVSPKDRQQLIAVAKQRVIDQVYKNLARARAEKGVQP